MATIKIGVLGAAKIAKKNIRGISFADRDIVEITAVGSRSLSKAQEFIQELQPYLKSEVKACGSYEEVLDLPDLHAVYIPLPSSMHATWVRKAAERGLHVLLEKPVATSSSDLAEILSVCKQHGVQLMDGTMWAHNPRAREMEAIIRDKEHFGSVLNVSSSFSFLGGEEFRAGNVRVKASGDPLGCLGDLGWYSVRAALWAFDYELPEYVTVHPGAVFNEEGVPMYLGATLIWPGEPRRRAILTCSFDLPFQQTLDVSGTLGSIYLRDFVIPSEERRSSFMSTSNHKQAFEDLTVRKEHEVLLSKPQETLMWEAFGRAVQNVQQGGLPDPLWIRLAELTQQVVLAIDHSAKIRAAVSVKTLAAHVNF
ncbi:hypothetical protein CEUSTIGMA_g3545.t1 [Chlamydomonas eustigma]|uniref:Uncharacterized protein n=1 Tax=Chlamydomonas eustigma TaxID=1157962 RepID=A0A250WZR3_9CHLO|nr:hypothetical protein CEUSTIGMA_g3545.t1 [Chlamydomonas eustigma]|eukprot:GAX76102.1 hypothetical protein CEUSTIGMA_g3545.t1 [Chlamydomonas eustigma]